MGGGRLRLTARTNPLLGVVLSCGPLPRLGTLRATRLPNFPLSRRWLLLPIVLIAALAVAVFAREPGASPRGRRVLLTSPAPTNTSPSSITSAPPSTSTTSTTSSSTTTTAPPSPATTAAPIAATNVVAGAPSPAISGPLVYYPGAPKDLSPLAPNPYYGEGHWVPAGRWVGSGPAVWVTTLRSPSGGDPAGIAQMDTTRLSIVPFAGTSQPGGTWSNQGEVPPSRESSLVAAFNGGFQFNSSQGGFYADGHAQPALRDGAASLVEFLDGSAIVGQWGRDVSMGPYVISVRQNLQLLVDGGSVVPAAANWPQWGATLNHGASTWRSGVGSDDQSHLYFVGGPGLTPSDLGSVLVAAGATRAMEFDINPQWVNFASYTDGAGSPPSTVGAKLLPSMYYGPEHFFSPDWRDFVAVFVKEKPSGSSTAK